MQFKNNLFLLGYSFAFQFSFGKAINISLLIAKKPTKSTMGVTSRCVDGKHVLFFDWDGLTFEEVISEIAYLQGYYKLSNFYIFELNVFDSFHGICLDKFNLYDAVEIVSNSSADRGFKKAPFLFKKKRWVLRTEKKGERDTPRFRCEIKSLNNEFSKSTAHKIFLEQHYKIKIGKLKYEDGFNDTIELIQYDTGNRTKKVL